MLRSFLPVALLILVCWVASSTQQDQLECIDGPSAWYNGTRSVTVSGIPCQRWDTTFPHKPKQQPQDGGNHNFCRNPDGDLKGTWCYTTNASKRWEYCRIPKCPDDSIVIWTNHDSKSGGAHLLSVKADPEIVKQVTDVSGVFNVSVMVSSNQSRTEFWALAADYDRKMLFFTDYMSEYIGVRYIGLNRTVQYLEGMAHGIENMAYDWKTGNLYWSDSTFKWIMAVERSFTYYTPVYRTNGDPPYAIAIHAKQRKLFFSIYKAFGSRIVSTDLGGKNEKVLFGFPHVYDVTGLTVDYTDDRLYWTDFTGYGGVVSSCKMDGSNKTQHHYRGGAIFWGITAYINYLYVTDVHARYSSTSKKYFSVWVINKESNNVFRYTLEGKPRGITVYSKNEDRSFDDVSTVGECVSQHQCDHICLPRINAKRECACSLGYTKVGETRCVTNIVQDNFMLVADSGQGKVFQIPLNASDSRQYSIVPIHNSKKITTVAIDAASQTFLWSDKRIASIRKSGFDGTRTSPLVRNQHANTIAVEHRSGNIYFADEETQIIHVADPSGLKVKTLLRPENVSTTEIKMLALDQRHNFLYWVDTRTAEGKGQAWRMNLDGSNRTLVFDGLNSPQAITIDYQSNSLYLVEGKTAMIYQKSLDQLMTINSTSHLSANQFDLSGQITRLAYFVTGIKVFNGTAYIIDGKSNVVEQFDLKSGPASLRKFGPTEFYRATSIAIYSSWYTQQYLSPLPNPCASRHPQCTAICVALSNTTSKCLCPDGTYAFGKACYGMTPKKEPPHYEEGTCPDDRTFVLLPCETTALVTWDAPQWKDDVTPTSQLIFTHPATKSPARFSEGSHTVMYTATDGDGLTAKCSFKISVTVISCGVPPPLPTYLTKKRPEDPCNTNYGAKYQVMCKDTNKQMVYVNEASDYFTNFCLQNGTWIFKTFIGAKCKPKANTVAPATQTTSSPVKQTNAQTSTTGTSSSPTSNGVPPPTNPGRKPGKTGNHEGKGKGKRGGTAVPASVGLQPGPIAAICVMAILLVVIVAAVVIITLRNRPIWKVARFEFPLFWKSKPETESNEQPMSENPYSVMT